MTTNPDPTERPDRAQRYANGVDDPDVTQGDRLLRYAHAVLDAFPNDDDDRPARALRNWRQCFHRHTAEVKEEIACWYADRSRHHTLTALLWHVGQRIYNRGDGLALIDFHEERQRLHLRFGLLELGKLLCREVEAERESTCRRCGRETKTPERCACCRQEDEIANAQPHS